MCTLSPGRLQACPRLFDEDGEKKGGSRLKHPNIIKYNDNFEEEGTLHILMEYANRTATTRDKLS